MLYPKNNEQTLSAELFQNPTSEYRGTPFWAWNGVLDDEELKRQIDIFKTMGLGGFHMHVRTGLDVPYLSEEFMDHIRFCVEEARKRGMLAWLYDEDRWPSGAAGGLVTKDPKYRERHLLFTVNKRDDDIEKEEAIRKADLNSVILMPYFLKECSKREKELGINIRLIRRDIVILYHLLVFVVEFLNQLLILRILTILNLLDNHQAITQ